MKNILIAFALIAGLAACALSPDRPPQPTGIGGGYFPAGPLYTGNDPGPGYKAAK